MSFEKEGSYTSSIRKAFNEASVRPFFTQLGQIEATTSRLESLYSNSQVALFLCRVELSRNFDSIHLNSKEKNTSKTINESLLSELSKIKEEKEDLGTELKSLKKNKNSFIDQIQQLESENRFLSLSKSKCEEELKTLRSKVTSLEQLKIDLSSRVSLLEDAKRDLTNVVDQLSNERLKASRMESELAIQKRNCQTLDLLVAQLQAERNQLQLSLSELNSNKNIKKQNFEAEVEKFASNLRDDYDKKLAILQSKLDLAENESGKMREALLKQGSSSEKSDSSDFAHRCSVSNFELASISNRQTTKSSSDSGSPDAIKEQNEELKMLLQTKQEVIETLKNEMSQIRSNLTDVCKNLSQKDKENQVHLDEIQKLQKENSELIFAKKNLLEKVKIVEDSMMAANKELKTKLNEVKKLEQVYNQLLSKEKKPF